MNNRVIKVPHGLTVAPHNQRILKVGGFSVIESCVFTEGKTGSLFLEDHLLLFVLCGTYTVRYGNQEYIVRKNEMVFLQKAIVVEYQKSGESNDDNLLDYMMFFLKDELLTEFIKMADIKNTRPEKSVAVSVKPIGDCLLRYIESLRPHFNSPDKVNETLIKLKLLELLFDLANEDQHIMQQLLQLKQQVRSNIAAVVEENIMNPVSLHDLAYLSGRSVSSFKRDFQAIYNTSPSQWIREKRLLKAKELLTNSCMSVTDICFATGFESVAHFSRTFKDHFGVPPSLYKQTAAAM